MIINDIYINDEYIYSKSIKQNLTFTDYKGTILYSDNFEYILSRDYTLYIYDDDTNNIKIISSIDDICNNLFDEFRYLSRKTDSGYYESIKSFILQQHQAPSLSIKDAFEDYLNNLKQKYSLKNNTNYSSIYNFNVEIVSTFNKIEEHHVLSKKICLDKCIRDNNIKYFKDRHMLLEDIKKDLFNKYILTNNSPTTLNRLEI